MTVEPSVRALNTPLTIDRLFEEKVAVHVENESIDPEPVQNHEKVIVTDTVFREKQQIESVQHPSKNEIEQTYLEVIPQSSIDDSFDSETVSIPTENTLSQPQHINVEEDFPAQEIAPIHEFVSDIIPSTVYEQKIPGDISLEETDYSEKDISNEHEAETHIIPVQAESLITGVIELEAVSEESLTIEIQSYLELIGDDIELIPENLLPVVTRFAEISKDIRQTYLSAEIVEHDEITELIEVTRELLDILGIESTEEAILSVLRLILPEKYIAEHLHEITLLVYENGTFEFNQWNLTKNLASSKKRFKLHLIGRMALGQQTL